MSYLLVGVLGMTALYLALRDSRRHRPADYTGKHRSVSRRGNQEA